MSILKKDQERKIPKKNYFYLAIIILGTFLLLYYIYNWYETYKESKLNVGIMNDYLTVINYNELEDYIIENKNAVIYVSVLGNEEINKFENVFKNAVKDEALKNKILYLNITDEDKSLVESKLEIDNNLPYIVVYTGGKITDTYSIAENNYSSQKTIKYLNRIGVTDID